MKQVAKKLAVRDAETMPSACKTVSKSSVRMTTNPTVIKLVALFAITMIQKNVSNASKSAPMMTNLTQVAVAKS